jgi:NADH-quinone oxidoreductase subunit J
MNTIFIIASIVAIVSTVMVITRLNAVHALLYLIVSLLAVSVIFYIIGAPFVAALEVIIYAGAIVVLFIFVIMMLNMSTEPKEQESKWLTPKMWILPSILILILLIDYIAAIRTGGNSLLNGNEIGPKEVGMSLYTKYVLGVELSGMLLLSGIVGAYHLGRQKKKVTHRFLNTND